MMRIPMSRFAERRKRFQRELDGGIAIVPGGKLRSRSNDVDYPFRQRSDLLYLTGFDQPDAIAVFTDDRFVLFVQARDPSAETWTGLRPGIEGAIEKFGADEAFPCSKFSEQLPELLSDRSRLYYKYGQDTGLDSVVSAALEVIRGQVRRGINGPEAIISPDRILHEMRLYKDPDELEVMRAAAAISNEAHRAAARICESGRYEYELEAALLFEFRRRGGSGPAYPSIVGSGENATILHYIENQSELRDGELVLIDAGVELDGYASDVTRTYPVGGRFEGIARDVYAVVIQAQEAAIASIRPGTTLPAIHDIALRCLVDGLVSLGALEGDVETLIKESAYRPFYMHSTGHFLGLDVHDVGHYSIAGQPQELRPGMAFTVEPGLYFSARDAETPASLQGIGVRIEDDVIITDSGYEVLTQAIPKKIDDLEAWMRG